MTPSDFLYSIQHRTSRQNLRLLLRILLALTILIIVCTMVFNVLMAREGRTYSWLTGLYWTLITMSTVGYGDITFTSAAGRIFSIFVLISGMVFILIMLPFAFVRFFQSEARIPRVLLRATSGHVVLTHYDTTTRMLIAKLTQYHYSYVLVVPDVEEAIRLYDQRFKVVVGDLDDPSTYHQVRVANAALVVTTVSDQINTIVAFTIREISETVPIVAIASNTASLDILRLAGCSHVFQIDKMIGESLAWRIIGGDAMTHVIGQFDELLIAEAVATGTPLVGKTLRESRIRELAGVNVVGVWERGHYEFAGPDTSITHYTVLVLAGSEDQLKQYDELFCIYHVAAAPVIIIGGGRVGRATAYALTEREIDFRIVERSLRRIDDPESYITGNAADIETLEQAGIRETGTVVITTHDDEMNVYLTMYCRRLRPDIQIISRTVMERNIPIMYRAGADFVVSESSMGANTIFNVLQRNDILTVAEGLDIFKTQVPSKLAGTTLAESSIREDTGCSVIAIQFDNKVHINPDPTLTLSTGADIILIGRAEDESQFLHRYGKG